MKIIKILQIVIGLIIVIFICIASYNAGRNSVYKEEYKYYEKTEILLDSINKWDNSFMDTVMETDTYYEYEVARENLR